MAKQPNRKPSKVYDVALGKMRVPPALVTQREFRQAHADRIGFGAHAVPVAATSMVAIGVNANPGQEHIRQQSRGAREK